MIGHWLHLKRDTYAWVSRCCSPLAELSKSGRCLPRAVRLGLPATTLREGVVDEAPTKGKPPARLGCRCRLPPVPTPESNGGKLSLGQPAYRQNPTRDQQPWSTRNTPAQKRIAPQKTKDQVIPIPSDRHGGRTSSVFSLLHVSAFALGFVVAKHPDPISRSEATCVLYESAVTSVLG